MKAMGKIMHTHVIIFLLILTKIETIVFLRKRKQDYLAQELTFGSQSEKGKPPLTGGFPFGDPSGARTQDPNIKSVVLYQLS